MEKHTLPLNLRKEHFSVAYVSAVAAAAGFGVESVKIDMGNVDLQIHQYPDRTDKKRQRNVECGQIDVQMKCTTVKHTRHQFHQQKDVHVYDLDMDDYQTLIYEGAIPRILIVMVVPEKNEHWLYQKIDYLYLHHCAYWTSLRGHAEVSNTSKRAVCLQHLFSVENLTNMMNVVGRGDHLFNDEYGAVVL